MVRSKTELAVTLSKIEGFSSPEVKLEQYPTESETSAQVLWQAFMEGNVENKVILDAGCGTGILGIGALLMGAKKVYFLDKSEASIAICKKNVSSISKRFEIDISEYEFINADIGSFNEKVDVVIQNPPFGTKLKHADKAFLEKAMEVAEVVYSIHKITSKEFVDAICKDHDFKVNYVIEKKMPIKAMYKFHKKKVEHIDIGIWKLSANKT